MPLYDYRCTKCEREVEVMHGIHDSGPETCEQCGGAMRKALSTPAIHFKGSGWAKKDAASAKKAKPKASTADTSDASSGPAAGKDKATKDGAESTKSPSTKDSGSTSKTASTTGSTTA